MRHSHGRPHRVHLRRAGLLAGATSLAVLATAGCDPHSDDVAAGTGGPAGPPRTGSGTPATPPATTAVRAPGAPAATPGCGSPTAR